MIIQDKIIRGSLMKIKRYIAIALSLLIMLALVGCGSDNSSDPEQKEIDEVEETAGESKPVELDDLQKLFCIITEEVSTYDDLCNLLDGTDYYVGESGNWEKTYSIGHDYQATMERTGDRVGPCVDVSFDEDGNFTRAEYGIYNDENSNYVGTIVFKSGLFTSGADHFDNAEDAFKDFLASKEENAK